MALPESIDDLLSRTDLTIELLKTHFPGLQGNILKHHGRTHAYHLFLQFDRQEAEKARTWIAGFAREKITTSLKQLEDAAQRETDPSFNGGTFFNLSLSASGYTALQISDINKPLQDEAFRDGMKERASVVADRVEDWEQGLQQQVDALIIIADSNSSEATKAKDLVLAEVAAFATVVSLQKGKILRNPQGIGIEHFGYADGISQPNFLAVADAPAARWEDNHALLSTLLVPEPGNEGQPSFGSYFVFRKLEQHVRKFKEQEAMLSRLFNNADGKSGIKNRQGKPNEELAGAMIVGRFEDGTAVSLHSDEMGIIREQQLENDFDYRDDTEGLKCPFHAHIRITNPRQDVGDFAQTVRLTRRGIPYNDIGRDEFDLEQDQPDGGVGLLFMCYQSSIVRQFEFIQQKWANEGDIGGTIVGQDAIIGQGPDATVKTLNSQWGMAVDPKPVPASFRDFVTMRGGEYFFTPSKNFLENL